MRKSVLSLAPAGVVLAASAIAVPAAAQEQEIEELIVTGSYIRRPSQFDSPSPLVNVTADDLAARAARHENAAAVWRAAAEAAPSLGMLGTVLGLIAMFAAMDDPATLGPAMALALLTTLYGIVFGTLLFGPAAARLERLSQAELRWQKAALARLEKLARAEIHTTHEWLKRRNRAEG